MYTGAVDRDALNSAFLAIKRVFVPQSVKYSNTNPKIAATDGHHGKDIEWKVSCYIDLAEHRGAMQKGIEPSAAMREACADLLERCDDIFTAWYTSVHGEGSVRKLTRRQSFVTRYRPLPQQSGLLRHVDGADVDGSLILALTGETGEGDPIDIPFAGGGVTVWDGEPEVARHYAMRPGDICTLDNCVWHQGNPISAGERWALVIFYDVGQTHKMRRLARIVLKAAQEKGKRTGHEAAERPRPLAPLSSSTQGAIAVRLAMGVATLGAALLAKTSGSAAM